MAVLTTIDEGDTFQKLLVWAIALSGIAAFIHVGVIQVHMEEWWGYGAFFMVAAVAQIFYGILLFFRPWEPRLDVEPPPPEEINRNERIFYWVGIIGNGLIITLWLVTRTVGIPFFGPEAGEVERFDVVSVISKSTELTLILLLVRMMLRNFRRMRGQIQPEVSEQL